MAEDGSRRPSASSEIKVLRTAFLIDYVIGMLLCSMFDLHISHIKIMSNKWVSAFHKYSLDPTHARRFEKLVRKIYI